MNKEIAAKVFSEEDMEGYPPTDPLKECPFGAFQQKQCTTCRLAVQLLTEEEIQQSRDSGNLSASDTAYTCVFIILAIDLGHLNHNMESIS